MADHGRDLPWVSADTDRLTASQAKQISTDGRERLDGGRVEIDHPSVHAGLTRRLATVESGPMGREVRQVLSRRLAPITDTRPRAVLYLRQSVARDDSVSLELQETAGRDHCARYGYEVVAVIADPGVSGRTFRRVGVTQVMAMVETREADVIVLWKWSRLSRSRRDWALAADRVDTAGGRIESATEPVDVTTSTGRLARGVLTEFAAFESERIGDVWKEVHQRRRRLGLPHAGYPRLGYQRSGTGYEPDTESAELVAELYRRYLRGHGVRLLADYAADCGLVSSRTGRPWTPRGLLYAMDSGFAAGLLHVHRTGEHPPGAHPAIISATTWRAYQHERRRRGDLPPRHVTPTTWLAGLVRCATCTYAMRAKTDPRYGKAYMYACETRGCASKATATRARCEKVMLEWLGTVATDATEAARLHERSAASRAVARADVTKLARDVASLDTALGRMVRQNALGVPAEVLANEVEVLKAERLRAVAALATAEAESDRPSVAHAVVVELRAQWDHLPLLQRREGLRELGLTLSVERRAGRRAQITVVERP